MMSVITVGVYMLHSLFYPVILFLVSLTLWHIYISNQRDRRCTSPLPPGHYGLPIVGESLTLLMQGTTFLDKKQLEYGNIYKTHIFGKPTIRIIGADNVHAILYGENTIVTSDWPKSAHALLEGGMALQASNSEHDLRKKSLLKAFTHESLCKYLPKMSTLIDRYIDKWCGNTSFIDLYTELRTLTFDITCTCLLGLQFTDEDLSNNMKDFEVFMGGMFSLPIDVPGFSFHKALSARERLLTEIERCTQHKNEIDKGNDVTEDVLTLLNKLHRDGDLRSSDIWCICLELLFAGHETTTSAATSLIINLFKYRAVAETVLKELQEHGVDNEGSTVVVDVINRLPYLRSVVIETLRLTPPIGAGYRKAIKTFEIEGFQIPKGWTVAYSIRESHQTSNYFKNPAVFVPERWYTKTVDDKKHILTFGGGKRRCIGKDFAQLLLKVLTIHILRSCTIHLKDKEVKMNHFPSPCPKDGLPAFVSRIKQ